MKSFNNTIGKMLLLMALPLGWSSCSDTWDDHYKEESHAEGTLWKALAEDAEISNFKNLLTAVDFQRTLDASQVFTIFAPTNEAFTTTECDSLIASYQKQKAKGVKDEYNTVITEFVKNHIALYNYSVSSSTQDTLVMMNGKYQVLGNNNISGSEFGRNNVLTNNGILFTIKKQVPYTPNIYEYLAKDSDLDSLTAFIRKYEYREFIASQSVPGDIINGQTHYLDSVTRLRNNIFSQLGSMNTEDSAYWMLAPTNAVWEAELAKNMKYFEYNTKVKERDSLMYRFPRLKIVEGALYSKYYNRKDSLDKVMKSTGAQLLAIGKGYSKENPREGWRYYFYGDESSELGAKDQLFAGKEETECSNGTIYKVTDEWPLSDEFMKRSAIVMESEVSGSVDSVYSMVTSKNPGTRAPNTVNVDPKNPFYNQVSNHSFIEIAPKSLNESKVLFNIYNVLSNVEYEVSIVVAPSMAADTLAQPNSNVFKATVFYQDAKGKETKFRQTKKLTSDPNKMDTILLGTHTFPTCSYGLSQAQVKILLEDASDNINLSKGLESATMRIDCFILKPTNK